MKTSHISLIKNSFLLTHAKNLFKKNLEKNPFLIGRLKFPCSIANGARVTANQKRRYVKSML